MPGDLVLLDGENVPGERRKKLQNPSPLTPAVQGQTVEVMAEMIPDGMAHAIERSVSQVTKTLIQGQRTDRIAEGRMGTNCWVAQEASYDRGWVSPGYQSCWRSGPHCCFVIPNLRVVEREGK